MRSLKTFWTLGLLLSVTRGAASSCPSSTLQCATSSLCVEEAELCDQISNCPDGSDESKVFCELWSHSDCEKGQAKCEENAMHGSGPTVPICRSWKSFCGRGQCAWRVNATMCGAIILKQKIPRFAGPSDLVLSAHTPAPPSSDSVTTEGVDDMASLLTVVNSNINSISSGSYPDPYNMTKYCLALMPSKMPRDNGGFFTLVTQVQRSVESMRNGAVGRLISDSFPAKVVAILSVMFLSFSLN